MCSYHNMDQMCTRLVGQSSVSSGWPDTITSWPLKVEPSEILMMMNISMTDLRHPWPRSALDFSCLKTRSQVHSLPSSQSWIEKTIVSFCKRGLVGPLHCPPLEEKQHSVLRSRTWPQGTTWIPHYPTWHQNHGFLSFLLFLDVCSQTLRSCKTLPAIGLSGPQQWLWLPSRLPGWHKGIKTNIFIVTPFPFLTNLPGQNIRRDSKMYLVFFGLLFLLVMLLNGF